VLGLGLFSTGTIEGGSSFTRWFNEDSSIGQRRSATHVEQTPISAPSVVRDDGRLPFGPRPTTQPASQPGKRFYRSPNGLVIAMLVDQAGGSEIHVDRASGTTGIVAVNGRDVYMTMTQTPDGLAVISFDWVENDRLVSILVLDQPAGGLTVEAAQEIAAAMMETVVE
jgi:hypothetical protein